MTESKRQNRARAVGEEASKRSSPGQAVGMEAGAPQTRLQPRSWFPLGVVVLLVLLQVLAPSRAWMIMLCGLGGMLLTAYLWARALGRAIRLRRRLRYGWAQVGETLEEEFTLHNGAWWRALWVEVDDHSTVPGYAIQQVLAVGGGETFRWRERALCRRRGVYSLGPWTVRMGDPFGLFGVTQHYEQVQTLVVVPPVQALSSVPLPRGVAVGRAAARQPALDITLNVSSTRRYMPGDPLRRIHWPSTARQRRLICKEFAAEVSGDAWIVLDLDSAVQAGRDEESTAEYGVILAASLADQMLRLNRAVGLVVSGAETVTLMPRQGQGQRWEILQTLARVQPGKGPSLGTLLEEMRPLLGRRMTLAVITPAEDIAWVEALWPLLRRGVAPTAILLEAASFGRPAQSETLRATLSGLGIPTQVVGRGFLAPEVGPRPYGSWEFKSTPTGHVVVTRRPREVLP